MGSGSIQLARIAGIRVGVHPSWFLVLFLFIFILSGNFRDVLDSSDTVAYLTAVASVLLFFGSLILHELGHALTARRLGIGISGIDLWLFGGVAKMTREPDTPGKELKVAIAGPLVTLAVVGACVGLGALVQGIGETIDAALLDGSADLTPVGLLLGWLASINVVLFVLNMLPAFPLDGGRITLALAWRVTGDRMKAVRVSAALGQVLSWALIGLGIFLALNGDAIGGVWLALIGMFIGSAARSAVAQARFSEKLGAVTVADIMDPHPVSIPGEVTAERAHEEWFLRYRWPWFPVVDADGRFAGLVRQEPVDAAVDAGQGATPVRELVAAADRVYHVEAGESIDVLLGSEPLRRLGALMAVDGDGVLRGVVTIDQVRRALVGVVEQPG